MAPRILIQKIRYLRVVGVCDNRIGMVCCSTMFHAGVVSQSMRPLLRSRPPDGKAALATSCAARIGGHFIHLMQYAQHG
jgi:hypothetical protein